MGWSELIHGVLKIQGIFFKLYQILGKVATKEFLHSFLWYKNPVTRDLWKEHKVPSKAVGWKKSEGTTNFQGRMVKNNLVKILVKQLRNNTSHQVKTN